VIVGDVALNNMEGLTSSLGGYDAATGGVCGYDESWDCGPPSKL